ncbi:patatin family protein [Corynebacterium hansenii]|uniref:Patatin family protein n=1 Tax=Corynebacterium hansenii TaxID=394964 RepID=A0ABV7ZKD4_9CORY|nr:patatin family protein [Corynebacterium hansenii]WJY99445.1 Patatin-like phospholipase [Corynebacterium hansenii]
MGERARETTAIDADPRTATRVGGDGAERIAAPNVALVLEGGGMRNSYTAPCIEVLLRHRVDVGWVGGISAGATMTANYLSGSIPRSRATFTTMTNNREFGGWGSFVRGRGYFNAEWIYEKSPLVPTAGIDPYPFDRFLSSATEMRIGSVRADTGENVYWGRDDVDSLQTLMKYVRASSTLPGFMVPPVIDGVRYVDGALGPSGGIPLQIAEQDGYDRFLVIMSRERSYVKPPVTRPAMMRRIFRRNPAVAEAIIARPERYNATRARLFELEREGRAVLFFPDEMKMSNRERDLAKLSAAYGAGLAQAERDWPKWREFFESEG